VIQTLPNELERVARLAMRRYPICPQAMADALAEVERTSRRGGLAWLGSVLQQRRIVCAGQALELNRLQRASRRDAAREAIHAAWDRLEPRVFTAQV